MIRSRKLATRVGLFACGAGLCLATGVVAHVRLQNPSNGNPLFWPAPGAISIVINSTGSADIPDGSHETSIRSAIRSWNDVTGTTMNLVEDASPASQARTDWPSTGIHLVMFDESNTSGFFPGGSGIVAITPVWFFSGGSISDADILFNGSQFSFSTDAASSSMDVEDVVAHELGHLLGLDHSGHGGATMYPFVSGSVTAHRSLSLDEVGGMRDAYPSGSFSSLTGNVQRLSNNSAVVGAWVVARDANGRTMGADLSDASGAFAIVGLDAGAYTVYASPLDAPVSAGNLTAGHTIQTDFEPAFFAPVVLGAASTAALGTLFVDADVALNLGGTGEALPLSAIADSVARSFVLRGASLTAGSSLAVSDPALTVSPTLWLGTQVQFLLTVPAGSAPGHVDVEVTNAGGDVAVLPAGIEIVPPKPVVSNVSPQVGQSGGGTAVTITGSGFRAGLRVVLGDQIYVDGDVGGATVADSGTITLTTAATIQGTHDVVVVDATGVEGRQAGAFTMDLLPVLSNVFPTVGASVGGTEVVLSGMNFQSGIQVRIDGVDQPQVVFESSGVVRIQTTSGTPGGPYVLEVENPSGALAQAAFAYVAQADPDVLLVDPAVGSAVGGETIEIQGSGFTASTAIEFDADPETGLGGVPAASVAFVDANTLEVVTPAHTGGTVPVLARNTSTGQATVMAAAFTFASADGGGGGGGCSTRNPDEPVRARDLLLQSVWLGCLAAYLALRARRRRARIPEIR